MTKEISVFFWHPPPCKYHHQGKCKAGKKCIFLHTDNAYSASPGNGKGSPSSKRASSPNKDKKEKRERKPKEFLSNKPKSTGLIATALMASLLASSLVHTQSMSNPVCRVCRNSSGEGRLALLCSSCHGMVCSRHVRDFCDGTQLMRPNLRTGRAQ